MRSFIYILVILFFFQEKPGAQPRQYLFSYIGVRDGLQEESVTMVQQDAKGYIWIASVNALQRYDGQRFLSFFPHGYDPNSLPQGGIRGIGIDRKNRLWILSGKATLGYMDVENFRYHPVTVQVPPGDQTKTAALHIDQDGHVILIFVGAGFITYNEASGIVASQYNSFQLPIGWEPLFFWQDKARNYWIGSQQGLLKYSATKKMMSYRGHNNENDPVIKKFADLTTVVFAFVDQTNRFWLTAWPKNNAVIQSYSPATGETIEWKNIIRKAVHNKYYDMFGITELSDGSLWMAGHNVLGRVNSANNVLEAVEPDLPGEYSIRFDDIHSLYEDREKNVWVSTNKGLFRFNPPAQLFRAVSNRLYGSDSVHTPDVNDFLQLPDGELLVGTWGDGIFSYDKNFAATQSRYVSRVSPPGEAMVWCITRRKNGDIWRGTQNGFLFIYEAATGKTIKINPPVFDNSTIRQIEEDQDGNMWLGTQRGYLVKWTSADNSFRLQHQLKAVIARILIDSSNCVWVCTDVNGVYRFRSSDAHVLATYTATGPKQTTLLINGAADILQYSDSLFIIASNGINMLNPHTNRFRYFTTEKGLPSADISNLAKDRNGYIWMSCSGGIVSYHPGKQKLSTYNASDGVHTTSFNTGASAVLNNGDIAFGTNHDFIVFDPVKVTVDDYRPPRVYISGFALMNTPLLVDSLTKMSRIKLQHFEHSLTIQFSTLSYQNLYGIYYMMEGLDKDWTRADKLNQATYNYLAPGKYIFKTGCRDSNGKFGEITALDIYITPPFWKTWWFVSLLAFAAIGILYWIDKLRVEEVRNTERIRTRIATSLTRDMSSTLSSINMLSELAKIKADKDMERTKEYIGQISDSSNRMMEVMEDMIWSINPENDELKYTIIRMKKYAAEVQQKYEVEVNFTVDKKVEELKLQMDRRHELFLIFKEALLNAGKHAASRFADVELRLEKSKLKMSITDNGVGFDTHTAGFGRGIIEMRKKADALKATLVIHSVQQTGTEVVLEMIP